MRDTYASPQPNDCEHGVNLDDDCVDCLKAQLAEADLFVAYCAGLDMPEAIRKMAKDYIDKWENNNG